MNFLYKSESIDYDFYYQDSTRPTVIFLHGWGGNKSSFIRSILLLKSKYNLLTLTMPTTATTTTSWTLFDYASMIENILHLYNIKSVNIICHSFGFRVATILKNTVKIDSLIITGGAGPKKESIIKRIERENKKILLSILNTPIPKKSRKKKFEYLYQFVASPDYQQLSQVNKETFKNIVNLNTIQSINFSCPILLFWGKWDNETKPWIAKKIAKRNRLNSELHLVKGGHFAYLENAEIFNNFVIKFLKKLKT